MAASKLVRISSGATQQEVLLSDVTTIGRQPTNTLQIVDRLVSKEHAIIARRVGTSGFQITDLESRNGTYVNDRLVDASQDLADGDVVRIGSTIWRFESPPALAIEPDTMQEIAGVEDAAPIHATMQIDLAHDFARADLVFDDKMLRADYEKLRLAYTLSGDLHAAKDIEELLARLLNRVFEWLPVDRGVVLLADDKGGEDPDAVVNRLQQAIVRVKPGVVLSGDDAELKVPRSILKHVVSRREAVLSTDARLDARFNNAQSVVLQGIRSSMTVPLLTADRTLGVLHVDSLLSSGLFTDKDLQVLAAVSRQASISIDNVLLQRRVIEEAKLRGSLSRMLSPNLVDRIVAGDLAIEKGGAQKRVTVMFADIRGFTSLTERLAPSDMVALMNEYFERVAGTVFKFEGTLDKYIGDAVMAVWGAPLAHEDDAERAVRAALDLADEQGCRLVAFYHSHPDHDAYFSAEDTAQATPFGEPSYPGALQVVVSVRERSVREIKAFAWSDQASAYVETPLEQA